MNDLFDAATDKRSALARVPIVVPVVLDQTFDYAVPAGLNAEPGAFVVVPFAGQTRIGVVWDRAIGPEKTVDPAKIKTVARVLDAPLLPDISRRFAEWVARYTLTPLGMVARMSMSAPAVFDPAPPKTGVTIASGAPPPVRSTPARERVLSVAEDGEVRVKSALAAEAGCGVSVIDGLLASGRLVEAPIPETPFPAPDPHRAAVALTAEQIAAALTLREAVSKREFSVTLLDGVTGSGKTEVYFEAVAEAIGAGRQALILLPEIALTSQFTARFKARFGCPPVEWHSDLSGAERARTWRGVAIGEARVIVGARSALFLPFRDLGLIVVDEEHDQGFKQDDRVFYQARDMAVARARLGGFAAVLASATPSVESEVNARAGRYARVRLPSRFTGTRLPPVTAIDMRTHPPERGRWLSPPLVEALAGTLARGRQSLLFLNRRGYAPLTLCRTCGHRLECPRCTAWLVEHRFRRRLECHHCGHSTPTPDACPKCQTAGALVACGPGVERVAEEVAERFPEARRVLLSSDLAPGLKEVRAVIAQIEAGEADIVIGTQIVAKGHHFPALATVGVVDGDLGVAHGSDPRAAERTFQLLHQVTGRAGRGTEEGRGFVQTYDPQHPVLAAIVKGDREAFLEREIAIRKRGLLPPFGRLAALVASGRDKRAVEVYARQVALAAPPVDRIAVLGPAEAPIAVLRGRHRWRLLVRAPRETDIQAYLRDWLAAAPPARGDLRLTVDVDPYGFL